MKLRDVQLSILQIMKDIDAHCKKHNIRYSLAFGSMLGAVRHNGFIPWDDDLDIYMPRNDYNLFLETWNYDSYSIVNSNTDAKYTNTFSKIKRKQDGDAETPFFVDIFPLDKCPRKKIIRKFLQFSGIMMVLMSRRNVPLNTGSLFEKITKFALKMIPAPICLRVWRLMEQFFSRYSDVTTDYDYFSCSILHNVYWFKPADFFDGLLLHQFEDAQFPIVKDYDWYLRKEYGDYMKLPPLEKRVSSHFDNLE